MNGPPERCLKGSLMTLPFRTSTRTTRLRAMIAALGIGVAVLAARATPSAAAALPTNPCALVSDNDVLHVLGWTVHSRERKAYDLHGGTGSMCFLASTQGQVVVILPDPGSDFPGISVYNDPNAAGLAQHLYGLCAEVTLYNGTVYVVRGHRNIAVRVVPDDHAASYGEVEGFANVVVKHLH